MDSIPQPKFNPVIRKNTILELPNDSLFSMIRLNDVWHGKFSARISNDSPYVEVSADNARLDRLQQILISDWFLKAERRERNGGSKV